MPSNEIRIHVARQPPHNGLPFSRAAGERINFAVSDDGTNGTQHFVRRVWFALYVLLYWILHVCAEGSCSHSNTSHSSRKS